MEISKADERDEQDKVSRAENRSKDRELARQGKGGSGRHITEGTEGPGTGGSEGYATWGTRGLEAQYWRVRRASHWIFRRALYYRGSLEGMVCEG